MISLRTTILPLLLLLTSGSAVFALPAADNLLNVRDLGGLTDEQRHKLDNLETDTPECMQKCTDARDNSSEHTYIPLCAINDQSTDEEDNDPDVKNSYSCLCTDKVYLADSMACFVKNVSHPINNARVTISNSIYSLIFLVRIKLHCVRYCLE